MEVVRHEEISCLSWDEGSIRRGKGTMNITAELSHGGAVHVACLKTSTGGEAVEVAGDVQDHLYRMSALVEDVRYGVASRGGDAQSLVPVEIKGGDAGTIEEAVLMTKTDDAAAAMKSQEEFDTQAEIF